MLIVRTMGNGDVTEAPFSRFGFDGGCAIAVIDEGVRKFVCEALISKEFHR